MFEQNIPIIQFSNVDKLTSLVVGRLDGIVEHVRLEIDRSIHENVHEERRDCDEMVMMQSRQFNDLGSNVD